MAFCSKCGTQLPDDATFCTSCGTATDAQQTVNAVPPAAGVDNEAADAQNNKAMGILAYFGILVLIPIFAAKNSKFARYHANQGLVLAICELAYSIVYGIICAILQSVLLGNLWDAMANASLYQTITTILALPSIALLVFAIIGIVNAAKGEKKELPVIGKFKILK